MDTALTFARFDLIFELLAAGAALESPELYKHVLLTAARKDRVDILDLFKDAGLDVNRPNHELDRVKHVYPRPSVRVLQKLHNCAKRGVHVVRSHEVCQTDARERIDYQCCR
eukprot:TRINITY_DN12439_c0_g1_i13.p7 TRINITY_DN12439_c0_g1~~TRINITY_DN12439_c0_g1_i13.p7  ORF type:complete len:112 (+),score=13.04 TRINITY_DN12439_c0_g1_i13:718-1053(+)